MTLEEAEILYVRLAITHNCDYKFKWLERRKKFWRAGDCFWKTKIIRLQPTFVELNSEEVVTQVILHEIAHALTPKHRHNKFWKKKAIEIGYKGVRCYGKEVKKL
jgi:predicted SprT family Zn-dependent metalloprotease